MESRDFIAIAPARFAIANFAPLRLWSKVLQELDGLFGHTLSGKVSVRALSKPSDASKVVSQCRVKLNYGGKEATVIFAMWEGHLELCLQVLQAVALAGGEVREGTEPPTENERKVQKHVDKLKAMLHK